MDLSPLGFPCRDGCPHAGECFEAVRRRAEGGHACVIVASPKMDAQELVAASCSCGAYRSGSTVEREARKSWRQHADAKMGWAADQGTVDGIRPHLPMTVAEAALAEEAARQTLAVPLDPEMLKRLRPREAPAVISTRPQDWAEPARGLLWPGRDRHR